MTIEEIDAATNAIFALVTKDMEPEEFDPDKLRSSIRGYAAEKVRGREPCRHAGNDWEYPGQP